jgi:hypothetical protein
VGTEDELEDVEDDIVWAGDEERLLLLEVEVVNVPADGEIGIIGTAGWTFGTAIPWETSACLVTFRVTGC